MAGIRVLELGSFIAGPFAGQLLGDYGADVVKVEPPGTGDVMRRWGQLEGGESLWWPAISRNKRSLALDLRTAAGRDVLLRLIPTCDIVIENFKPGKLAEWGLGYDRLAEANPGIIVAHVSGFGQTGPRAAEAGFGSVGEAVGGIRYTTGDPDRRPARTGVSLGDSLAAMFAVIGCLAALAERNRSGRGQEVDVAIYEAVAAVMESTMADYERAGVVRSRTGSVLPGVAPSNVYTSADGVEIIIAANADTVFSRLCAAMQRPDLVVDPRYAGHVDRGRNMASLDAEIDRWVATAPADEVLAVLARFGVPAGRIYTAADMLADPHYQARGMVQWVKTAQGTSVPMAGVVPKFSRTPGTIRAGGPRLGEHTAQVLADLVEASAAEVGRLRDAGTVQ